MKVLDFIKERGVDALSNDLAIEVKRTDDLLVLNYSQIDSPKMDPVVQECRGLVLKDQTFDVLCRPFPRFLNYGEGDTKDFDFGDVTIFEKADGSMVKIYWNESRGRFEIATRGSAYGEVPHSFGLKTDWNFREAILDAMKLSETEFQELAEKCIVKGSTVVMEYISPFNRIVTHYSQPMVVLLAVRDNDTGHEFDLNQLRTYAEIMANLGMNVRMPAVYQANGADEIVKLAESLTNLQEGFVVVNNKTFDRVKVKSSTYCAVHHLRGNGTPSVSRLTEVVINNEQDELLAYFPEFNEFVQPIVEKLHFLLSQAEGMYEIYKSLEEQKQFAMAVKNQPYASLLFRARRDGNGVHETWNNMDMNQKLNLMEKFQ